MAEHKKITEKNQEKVDQKHAVRRNEPETLFGRHAWEQAAFPITGTPFQPPMGAHAELLARAPSDEHRASLVKHLQQTYGNRYVQRLLNSRLVQAKLTISAPNDVYEQEANRVAKAVTRTSNSQLQRQEVPEEEEEQQDVMMKALGSQVLGSQSQRHIRERDSDHAKRNRANLVQRSDIIQRDNGDLPSIDHLPAMAQTLLDGALEEKTIDAAVRKIYDNTFTTETGWKYNASNMNTKGESYIEGGQTEGMCESFRNAFKYILEIYDGLRKSHPEEAIKNGELKIDLGDDLVTERFYTKGGLTLMGATALKGNVYLEVDGQGNVVNQGEDAINRFVFNGHWTLIVNNVKYDPIFHVIGTDTVETLLDKVYSDGTMRLLADTTRPVASGEFGATFVLVNDYTTFDAIKTEIESFYNDNKEDVDSMLSILPKKRRLPRSFFAKYDDIFKQAKKLIADNITNIDDYGKILEVGYLTGATTRSQRIAFNKIAQVVKY